MGNITVPVTASQQAAKKNTKASLADLHSQLSKLHRGQPVSQPVSQPPTPVHTPHPSHNATVDPSQVVPSTQSATGQDAQPVTASMSTMSTAQAAMSSGTAVHNNPPQVIPPAGQPPGHKRQSSQPSLTEYADPHVAPITVSASSPNIEVEDAAELQPNRRKSDGEILKSAAAGRFQVQRVPEDSMVEEIHDENASIDRKLSGAALDSEDNRPRAHSDVIRKSSNELNAKATSKALDTATPSVIKKGRFQVTPTDPDVLPPGSNVTADGQPSPEVKEVLTNLVTQTAQSIDKDKTSPGASPTHSAPKQHTHKHGRFQISNVQEDLASAVDRVNAENAAAQQMQQAELQRPPLSSTPPIQLDGTTIVESEPSPRDLGTPTKMVIERKSSIVSSVSSGRGTPDSTTAETIPTNQVVAAADMVAYGSRIPQQQQQQQLQQPMAGVPVSQVTPPDRTTSPGSVVSVMIVDRCFYYI